MNNVQKIVNKYTLSEIFFLNLGFKSESRNFIFPNFKIKKKYFVGVFNVV